MIIEENRIPTLDECLKLYNDVGWTAYTREPEVLMASLKGSLKVWTVWEEERLIGLARVVGDGHTILYIQDILVLEAYQERGIGSDLLQRILKDYSSLRQIVLLTDNTEKSLRFYEKNGLHPVSQYNTVAFMK